MKAGSLALCLLVTALVNPICLAANQHDLNSPIPNSARELVEQAIAFRERDQFEPTAQLFKKAIALAPNCDCCSERGPQTSV